MSGYEVPEAPSRWYLTEEQRRSLRGTNQHPVHPPCMTYERFLAWVDEDTLAEWVEGQVVMLRPASLRHQEIVQFLLQILSSFAETHALGEAIAAPFQMRLETSGREPDALFVASAHVDRLKPTYLDGPADLAVEIVSPGKRGARPRR